MWDFLKKIFSKRDGDVTVVVIDDGDPEQSGTFRFQSADMIKIILVVIALSVTMTTVIFFVTPLGSLYRHQQDESLRQDIITIADKVFALQDSLDARDNQLMDLKQILVETPDTFFQPQFISEISGSSSGTSFDRMFVGGGAPAYEMLSRNEIIFSEILNNAPEFPTAYPVEGTLSQNFTPADQHFGIDIAAREQTEFKAIADGTVVNSGWTVKYGYVIYLQHADGYLSVYKHGASLFKTEGDIIIRGDVLGTVGDKGALSFGSHLHLEIWKNGVAQDPTMYLIK